MPGALEGIKVIEWAGFHNGPAAGYMLGDLGAEVIKIEEPVRGDPMRGMTQMYGDAMTLADGRLATFELANRNKRGITVDLTQQKGRDIVYKLVEKADVFYTNYYRNNVLKRVGMDYDTMVKYNPRLIYAVNSAYGLEGPMGDERGFDTIAQARTGMMWMMGDRDTEGPVQVVGAPCDQMGATMLAYAILAALLARERQGIAQKVEVSLMGSALHLQGIGLNVTSLRGRAHARHSQKRARNPMGNHYKCADGKWLLLAEPQSDRFWPQFCQAMGLEELENDPRFTTAVGGRREHYAELIEILNRLFLSRTRDEWLTRFEEKGVEFAYSPVFDYSEVMTDSQVLLNDYLTDFDHPTLGRVKFLNTPIKFSRTPSGPVREAPELGQHTEEVLTEYLDYSWEDVAQLKNEGAIG
ncbi:MAG: CoA transferase [Dehalococcoidia bacterium]|nr:CoA transferase [Dehalococcoidia bacterium]MDP6509864.1 CoA transferase [Dehalococcoidia bacterium]MDP6782274.1 CoA transferase [Dehalococcoidia bacterium]